MNQYSKTILVHRDHLFAALYTCSDQQAANNGDCPALDYAEQMLGDARNDLATSFLALAIANRHAAVAIARSQSWPRSHPVVARGGKPPTLPACIADHGHCRPVL